VPPATFRDHVACLKRHFRMRLLRDVVDDLERGSPLQGRQVALTLDDGYLDNLLHALPILEAAQASATLFVASGGIGAGREFWWDRLERAVLDAPPARGRFDISLQGHPASWPSGTPTERRRLLDILAGLMRGLDGGARDRMAEAVEAWAGLDATPRSTHAPLDAEQLRRFAASPWADIGGHGHSHGSLAWLPVEEQQADIRQGKEAVEALLGRPIRLFAYPFGEPGDYTADTVAAVQGCGYRAAFTTSAAVIRGGAWPDLFRLPRLFIADWPAQRLLDRLRSLWASG
jgi:peptidoglycan/xylan/chitin deacetylase (PgdA/CDA1 family)